MERADLGPILLDVAPGEGEEFEAARYRDFLGHVEVWKHEPTVADLDGFAAEVEAVDHQHE